MTLTCFECGKQTLKVVFVTVGLSGGGRAERAYCGECFAIEYLHLDMKKLCHACGKEHTGYECVNAHGSWE